MAKQNNARKRERIITIVFSALTVILGIIFYLDRDSIVEIAKNGNLWAFLLCFIFMGSAYIFFALGTRFSHKIFDIKLPFVFEFVVTYITTAIGNLMDWGGVVGYTMRASMLQTKDVKVADSFAADLFQTYFAFLLLLLLLPIALFGLLISKNLTPENQKVILSSATIGFVGSLFMASLVFFKTWRDQIIRLLCFIFEKLFRKTIKPNLMNFSNTLERGVKNIKSHQAEFIKMLLFLLLAWFSCIMIVQSSFFGLGVSIDLPVLITGFIIGMVVTNFAFIPGGFGVQEGSMAGIFALFGVDLHVALLVTLIFRVFYYFIPNFFGLFLYWTEYRSYMHDE